MKWIKQSRNIRQHELQFLEESLANFYLNPHQDYQEDSREANINWSLPNHVFHKRIVDRAYSGAKVLDVGCGPAMACPHFLDKDALYTGIDLNEKQIEINKTRFPKGQFFAFNWRDIIQLDVMYDVVTSFFFLEHIVLPKEFLEASARCVKKNGFLCILCPHFLDLGYMPSLYFFGRNPGGIRIKIRNHQWIEVVNEIINRYIVFPFFLRRARFMAKRDGAWVINLHPACLDTNSWKSDWDAVYMASEDEIAKYIEGLGFRLIERGASFRQSSIPGTYPNFCYVVGQKC